jgi:hypothetical protein
VPPISLVLLGNANSYVEGLTLFRDGDIAGWSTRFAHALHDATVLATGLGAALAELQASWREAAERPRRTSATQRLIELLAARPMIDIPMVSTLLDVSYPQAREAVLRLEGAGVLKSVSIGRKRNRAWEAPDLSALLDNIEVEALTSTRRDEQRRVSPRRAAIRAAYGHVYAASAPDIDQMLDEIDRGSGRSRPEGSTGSRGSSA